jgi:hypothetical protein
MGLRVVLAVAIGVAAAAGLAGIRGGVYSEQFRVSLWVVGCLMILMAIFSYSPSTRDAPGEMSKAIYGWRYSGRGRDDRGGASVTLVLALAAAGMFGIALLVS